jgi:diacylglycerol kinase
MFTAALISSGLAVLFGLWNARISSQRDNASTGEERMERDLAGGIAAGLCLTAIVVAVVLWGIVGLDMRYGGGY